MNKSLPYIVGALLVAAVIVLIITGGSEAKKKAIDQRVTLRKQDKIPYGTYAAYQNLQYLFPDASIYVSRREPGYWDSLFTYESGQAFITVTDLFSADKYDMKRLIEFAKNGNDVFVSARYISAAADELLHCSTSSLDLSFVPFTELSDSMTISLENPPYAGDSSFSYPGKTFYTYFSTIDTLRTDVLGRDEAGRPDFIHMAAGSGHFYIHLEPLAFSNYFMLHKKNIRYYEKALSVINPGVKKIVWDEYFLNQRQNRSNRERKGWFTVLMNMKNEAGQKPFRAAFWILLLLLLLYVLMEMRRKQRYIPVIHKPKNDSLDFVRTIGRLYYDKANHFNLCRKMTSYFLEHVRNRYKLSTAVLDENFITNLKYKTGYDEAGLRNIVSFIRYLEEGPAINQQQLTVFHKQLESFYKSA